MYRDWPKRMVLMAVLISPWLSAVSAVAQKPSGAGGDTTTAETPAAGLGGLAPTPSIDDNAVLAKVNGKPVRVADFRLALAAVLRGRPVDARSVVLVQAEVLATLIDRLLVEQAMGDRLLKSDSDEVNEAISKLKSQSAGKVNFEEFLAAQGVNEKTLRQQIAWQMTWSAYLNENMTDEMVEDYFREHRQEYDGTELRASHILLRPLNFSDEKQVAALVKKANELKEQIEKGEITFEAAAKQYSDGPSKVQGGDVGYFPRNGVMEDVFSKAAFGLEKGAISAPVTSNFGVHLIRVTGEKAGEKDWTDVRDQLKAPVSQQLFNDLAAKERGKAKIEFAPQMPHFKPGTRELVVFKPSDASASKKPATEKKSTGDKSGTKKPATKK